MCKSPKKYSRLRGLMATYSVTQYDVADAWNEIHPDRRKYQPEISLCLSGKHQMSFEFVKFLCDLLHIQSEDIMYYFDPNGEDEGLVWN